MSVLPQTSSGYAVSNRQFALDTRHAATTRGSGLSLIVTRSVSRYSSRMSGRFFHIIECEGRSWCRPPGSRLHPQALLDAGDIIPDRELEGSAARRRPRPPTPSPPPAARLMLHKAECLLAAGVITEAERTAALERANPILAKFGIAR
jgi:hypothetical protein